jgi:hypothetical protein
MVPRHYFSHIQGQQFLGLGGYILEGTTAMKYEVHLAPGSVVLCLLPDASRWK